MKSTMISLLALLLASPVWAEEQQCNSHSTPSTPDSRFTISNDGTVSDLQTGLMWQRCSLGQSWDGTACTGSANTYDWATALVAAEEHSFAGQSDWRLPNIKELASIVETACYQPAINLEAFSSEPSGIYLSSSPFAWDSDNVWFVSFKRGGADVLEKSDAYYVRLVRAGQ